MEHLSLRGTFWPSACAAAIKELQISLNGKTTESPTSRSNASKMVLRTDNVANRPLTPQFPANTPRRTNGEGSGYKDTTYNEYRPMTNANYENTRPHMAPETRDISQSHEFGRFTGHRLGTPVSASYGQNYTEGEGLETPSVARQPLQTFMIQDSPDTLPYATYAASQVENLWPNLSGASGILNDQLNGFDDIFQLTDVPYLFNDQFSQAQLGSFGINGYPMI
jgi:hypothetical protein